METGFVVIMKNTTPPNEVGKLIEEVFKNKWVKQIEGKMKIEDLKLEIFEEFQREMLYRGISVLDAYKIGKAVRIKFNIKHEHKTKTEIIEEVRKELLG